MEICRVCRDGDDELVPIYEQSNRIGLGIYIICGVKILESKKPLICISCVKSLSKAIQFRNKCRESDVLLASIDLQVKEENEGEPGQALIKDEPVDFSLFDNIDTILYENLDGNLTDVLRNGKTEELYSDSSGSTEYRRKRKLKKRAAELRDYELR